MKKHLPFFFAWGIFYLLFRLHSVSYQGLTAIEETNKPLVLSILFSPIKLFIEFWMFGLPALFPSVGLYGLAISGVKLLSASSMGQRIKYAKLSLLFLGILLFGVIAILKWWSGLASRGDDCFPYGGLGGGPTC